MMKRKYTLANLENCSNKFFGRNVKNVYFVVLIEFIVMRLSWVLLSLDLNDQMSSPSSFLF